MMNQENGLTLSLTIDKYQTYYYAGASGDFNPIHLDDDFAQSAGLGGKILHGLCTMAYVYRAAIGNNDPGKLKKFKVRFRGIVKPNDTITIKGKLSIQSNNTSQIELVAENQKGEQVITNGLAILDNTIDEN